MSVIRVGSRDSKLAVIQAQMVIDAIKKYDPSLQTELITMKTTGDKILNMTLDAIGGKGLFIKELDEALLNGSVDITVHSFKDMPMELPEQLPIVALSEREDPRDVLIYPEGIQYPSKPAGCSSKRRTIQLKELGFQNIAPLRGNVLTRLKKLDEGEYSAIVLAAAGIKRLGLKDRINRYFDTEEIMPAACQGIISVQARKGENTEYLSLFHSEASKLVSDAERAFVTALEGGCSSPIAAYAVIEKEQLVLKGMYVSEETGQIRKGMLRGNITDGILIGKELARQLKQEGMS